MTMTTPIKDSPQAGVRLMLTLCVIVFLAYLNELMLWPFYVEVARDFDTSISLVGQTTTLAVLVSAVLGILIGPLADHYGHRRTLLFGAAGVVVSAFGTALASSFVMLLIARLLSGVSAGVSVSVVLAVAGSRFAGEARRKAMSWAIAAIAAPAIGGIPVIAGFGDLVGWQWSFALVGAIAAGGCGLLRLSLPADPPVGADPFRLDSVLAAYRPFVGHWPTLTLFAGNALRAIAWIGMLTYFGAFWVDAKDLSVSGSGLMLMIGGTGYFTGSLVAGEAGPLRPTAALCLLDGNVNHDPWSALHAAGRAGAAGRAAVYRRLPGRIRLRGTHHAAGQRNARRSGRDDGVE
jgi:predicted MFS family arabinose efflux permease